MTDGWWKIKEDRFKQALRSINEKKEPIIVVEDVFSFIPEDDIPNVKLIHRDHSYFDDPNNQADIFINQGYDHDIDAIWKLTKKQQVKITSCWFWDNHHLQKSTMRGSMLADVTFCAHNFAAHYNNELGKYGGFVPLCGIFWGSKLVEEIFEECKNVPRSNELFGGFNSYQEFPDRDKFLAQIKAVIPDHHIRQWPHGTPWSQHGYYSLTHADKLREWCAYKVALCVSFGSNTTMRMFEALVAGQIPLVVGNISDLDLIISPADQASLPIVKVTEADPYLVEKAFRLAVALFDKDGYEGIERRSNYARALHMPRNRIIQMVEAITKMEV